MRSETASIASRYVNPSLTEKISARIFSYLFHPLFIPVYVVMFLVYIHPSAFSGFSALEKRQTIFIVLLNCVFYPLISVVLLRAVGFIESVYMHTKKDRIIPYMACGIFFFWAYTVFKQQPAYTRLLPSFLLGIFLASSAGLIANIYFKISLHAIGMGGWLGFFLILYVNSSMHMTWPLATVILLTGLVLTARLMVSNHSTKEIYSGLIAGIVTQFAAAFFVL
jgi:nitrate reductase NapE component